MARWESKLEKFAAGLRENSALSVRLIAWNGRIFDLGQFSKPSVVIHVKHSAALRRIMVPSLNNLGEAYITGMIDLEGKLTDVVQQAYALSTHLVPMNGRLARIVRHFGHNRAADRAAIQYHYDLSNAFYQQWLDQNMVYSCAYFENGDEDLDEAQLKKIDHILTKIRLQHGQSLLDIGCGWGTLVIRAAQRFGARCVGVTLSQNQYDLARERVQQVGLADRVDIRLLDYRDLSGHFDRITSVGMFEHVGKKNLPGYFKKICDLLSDDGLALNHGITSTDAAGGEVGRGGGEFIDRYVFPNGELAHISQVLHAMQVGGLEALDLENLRRHYMKTLTYWADNFERMQDQVRHLIDPKKFRIWRVYLATCALLFDRDELAIFQVLCQKSGQMALSHRWSRQYMYR